MEDIPNASKILKTHYGKTPEGQSVELFKLKNSYGIEVDIITYGGIITSLKVPNKEGKIEDIVLGFDTLEEYMNGSLYFGALIGRFANRIAKGEFSLNQRKYTLATNNGENHLHGGEKGFDKVIWTAKPIEGGDFSSLQLTYMSKDMEEGYPGNLTTIVTYTLTNNNELKVVYEAVTDKSTIVNFTQHSYFNLSGDLTKSILDHELVINADAFLPIDANLIPTGEFRNVANTPFDFKTAKHIGKEIELDNKQLNYGIGYDHNWVLNNQYAGIRFVASAYDRNSGRLLKVFSDQLGIQFYSGNFINDGLKIKNNSQYNQRSAFCLETQHYPDTPNKKDFPSVVLNPDEKFESETIFKFSTK